MATFQDRLNNAMGERGYQSVMRRSVQTVILYEAQRCLKDKLLTLKPFQRKLAVFDQAHYLLSQSSLHPHQRVEVMYRTGKSKEFLTPENLFKRSVTLMSDLNKVVEQILPLCTKNKTHLEVFSAFLQKTYNDTQGKNGELYPPNWEFTHNHNFMAYKVYYNRGHIDGTFPPPEPREIVVPATRPAGGLASYAPQLGAPYPGAASAASAATPVAAHRSGIGSRASGGGGGVVVPGAGGATTTAPSAAVASASSATEKEAAYQDAMEYSERRNRVEEVRMYMDLLERFDRLDRSLVAKRQRELFEALPPAPPPFGRLRRGPPSIDAEAGGAGNNGSPDGLAEEDATGATAATGVEGDGGQEQELRPPPRKVPRLGTETDEDVEDEDGDDDDGDDGDGGDDGDNANAADI